MKRLIINADDFGLHPLVNKAIIEAHERGCVTSTSLMPTGAAFEDAVTLAAGQPRLGIGIHLTLVGERPVSPPALIPSLVDGEGRLPAQYPAFLARFLLGRISLTEVRSELTAQMAKVAATGLVISHIDSHQHLHVLPGIDDIIFELAAAYKIKAVRIPAEPPLFIGGYPFSLGRFLGRLGLTILASRAGRRARQRGLTTPDHFYGMLAGGNLRQEYLLNIIDSLPAGDSEIMTHPGADDAVLGAGFDWRYAWQGELASLISPAVRQRLADSGIELITFWELGHD